MRVRFKEMETSAAMPRVRRLLGPMALGTAALAFASMALRPGSFFDVGLFVFASVVAAGAVGLGLRSVRAQVLARGVGWAVLAPSLLGIADAFGHGRLPDAPSVFFTATSAAALLFARPMLHTPTARAEFSPVAYRRPFLAGAVASAMVGTAMALFAFEMFHWGAKGPGLGLSVLAATLLASAAGVARMRSWGVLLGILGSVGTLAAAALSGNEVFGVGLALAAFPGAMLAAPLVAARLGVGNGPAPTTAPDDVMLHAPELDVRTRIALAEEDPLDEAPEPAHMVAGQ